MQSVNRRVLRFGAWAWTVGTLLAWGGCVGEDAPIFLTVPDVTESSDTYGCTPGEVRCQALLIGETCGEDGETWEPFPCEAGSSCVESGQGCIPHFCNPFEMLCTSDKTYRQCTAAGMTFEDRLCQEGYYCLESYCVYGACLGHVLLVLDRSGSMKTHWNAVKNSVMNLVQENPSTRFGLLTFPGSGKCQSSPGPQITLRAHGATDAFENYFAAVLPVGSTPLLKAMETVRDRHGFIFEGQAGVVVVISDGEDTCSKPELDGPLGDALSVATQELAQAGVKTYVIGYNFEGNTAQLDAIASQGNTGQTVHTPAGSETDLNDAFQGIVSDIKLCF
jgi:hypothetical protein